MKAFESNYEGGIPDNEQQSFEEPDQRESPVVKKKKGAGLTNE